MAGMYYQTFQKRGIATEACIPDISKKSHQGQVELSVDLEQEAGRLLQDTYH